jgi:hypothetical protein
MNVAPKFVYGPKNVQVHAPDTQSTAVIEAIKNGKCPFCLLDLPRENRVVKTKARYWGNNEGNEIIYLSCTNIRCSQNIQEESKIEDFVNSLSLTKSKSKERRAFVIGEMVKYRRLINNPYEESHFIENCIKSSSIDDIHDLLRACGAFYAGEIAYDDY